jgi:hypothetical protein
MPLAEGVTIIGFAAACGVVRFSVHCVHNLRMFCRGLIHLTLFLAGAVLLFVAEPARPWFCRNATT